MLPPLIRSMLAFTAAAPRVTVSPPPPPTIDARWRPSACCRRPRGSACRLPAPNATLPLVTSVPSVIVSVPAPPTRVLMLLTVPVLLASDRVSLLSPAPRSTDMALVSAVARVMVSFAGAADDGLDIGDRCGVGEVAEGERVPAAAEVDAGIARDGIEGDRVGAGAADQRVDVADRAGVGEVAEGQLVGAGPRIHLHAVGQRGGQGDAVVAGPAGDRFDVRDRGRVV